MTTAAKPIRHSVRAIPLPLWVVFGALAGIIAGVVFGERTSILQPLGSAYAMMLQIAVYPYLLCALIYGLGRLTPAEAKRLFGAGWGVYLFMWCVTLVCHLAAGARHPADARPQRADAGCRARRGRFPQDADSGQPDRRRGAGLCARGRRVRHRLRNRDPEDRAQVGAVRGPQAIQVASVTLWGWIVRFAPIGVFALFAVAAGTIEPSRLSGLLLYVALFLIGTLLLAFVVLPRRDGGPRADRLPGDREGAAAGAGDRGRHHPVGRGPAVRPARGRAHRRRGGLPGQRGAQQRDQGRAGAELRAGPARQLFPLPADALRRLRVQGAALGDGTAVAAAVVAAVGHGLADRHRRRRGLHRPLAAPAGGADRPVPRNLDRDALRPGGAVGGGLRLRHDARSPHLFRARCGCAPIVRPSPRR